MPFTPAHAVVALPFVRSRRWPAAAVAAGAVAPDLPLFVSGGAGYRQTHALWAVPTLDALLGLALLALWWGLVRPGLLAVAPAAIRARVRQRRAASPVPTVLAVVLGALTHVVWDAFTHRDRLGEALIPALGERLGPFAVTAWLQYASGVVGVAVLAGAAVAACVRTRPDPFRAASPLGRALPVVASAAVIVPIAAAIAAVGIAAARAGRPSVSGTAYTAVTVWVLWAGVAATLIGLVVRIRAGRSPRGRAPAGA